MKYLLVGQNGIARITKKTSQDIIGLTTQIEPCIAIAIIGKDEISMLHADSGTDCSPLLDEMKLITEPKKIIVVRFDWDRKTSPLSKESHDRTFEQCRAFLKEHKLDSTYECQFAITKTRVVNLSRKGVLTTDILWEKEMQLSPQKDLRDSIHFFNMIFSKDQTRPAVVEFNGTDSLGLPALTPIGALLISRIHRNLCARNIKNYDLEKVRTEMLELFNSSTFSLYGDFTNLNQANLNGLVSDALNILENDIGLRETAIIEAMQAGSNKVALMSIFSSALRGATREIQHDAILRSLGIRRD